MYTTDGSLPEAPAPADDSSDNDEGVQSRWVQMLTNGNCEGDDASCFVCRDGDGEGDVTRCQGACYRQPSECLANTVLYLCP